MDCFNERHFYDIAKLLLDSLFFKLSLHWSSGVRESFIVMILYQLIPFLLTKEIKYKKDLLSLIIVKTSLISVVDEEHTKLRFHLQNSNLSKKEQYEARKRICSVIEERIRVEEVRRGMFGEIENSKNWVSNLKIIGDEYKRLKDRPENKKGIEEKMIKYCRNYIIMLKDEVERINKIYLEGDLKKIMKNKPSLKLNIELDHEDKESNKSKEW